MPDDLVEEQLSPDEQEFADSVADYVERTVQPVADMVVRLATRLDALEERVGSVEEQAEALRKRGLEYRGVWTDHDSYEVGHCATWGGSLWVAMRDAPDKPGEPDSGWKLCVKAGARGRDAPDRMHDLDALERRIEALEGARKPRQLMPVSDRKEGPL